MSSIYDLNEVHRKLRVTPRTRMPKPANFYDLPGMHALMRARKEKLRSVSRVKKAGWN